jgi:hypothetical protein
VALGQIWPAGRQLDHAGLKNNITVQPVKEIVLFTQEVLALCDLEKKKQNAKIFSRPKTSSSYPSLKNRLPCTGLFRRDRSKSQKSKEMLVLFFSVVMLCKLVGRYQRFRETWAYCLHLQG